MDEKDVPLVWEKWGPWGAMALATVLSLFGTRKASVAVTADRLEDFEKRIDGIETKLRAMLRSSSTNQESMSVIEQQIAHIRISHDGRLDEITRNLEDAQKLLGEIRGVIQELQRAQLRGGKDGQRP